MLSLATAKCFRGRYTILALGELFLSDLKVLLELCGMNLLSHVCKGSWGRWVLAAYTMPGAFADSHKRLLCLLPAPSQTSLSVLKGECTTEVS